MTSQPKTLPGELTISRTTSNVRPNYIRIRLIDGPSHQVITDIELTTEDFALTITGQAFVECTHRTDMGCPVGKVRETKTVPVFVPDREAAADKALAEQAVAAKEVELGEEWRGRISDATNHHNRIRGGTTEKDGGWYGVTFVRFVDPPEEPKENLVP